MTSYLARLNSEFDSLSCAQFQVETVLKMLDSNSTIYKTRSKQLEKISVAIQQLNMERDAIQKSISNTTTTTTIPITATIPIPTIPIVSIIDSPDGRKFSDGKRAISCLGYRNSTSDYLPNGLYQIETDSRILTVFCDMTTAGGGWTMFAAIARGYSGPLFRVFDNSSAGVSSYNSTFHIVSKGLLARSTFIMAASDSATNVINNFYTSNWTYSAYCNITQQFRDKTNTPLTAEDLPTVCTVVNGMIPDNKPTHFTYGASANGHSIGFRMGRQHPSSIAGHMNAGSWATFSYMNGLSTGETSLGDFPGLSYNFAGTSVFNTENRNGALFLK